MNIPKARKILSQAVEGTWPVPNTDLGKAMRLGEEALQFFQEFQKVTGGHQDARLPSETKD